MIKVGVVGYGTIGKRVADAVLLQDDMELIGVTANSYNYRIKGAAKKGINIFPCSYRFFADSPIKAVAGTYQDLIEESDVVVDCTPKGVGDQNKDTYMAANTKAVFQGGEKPHVGKSFVSQCNYEEAMGSNFIRVVSCNTTGLCRTLGAIGQNYNIDKVHATMIRRAADPWDIYHGPINALVPHLVVPSHHGPDVRTVMPELAIFTTSISVPTTLMHMHSVTVDLCVESSVEKIIDIFSNTTRVRVVHNSDGIRSTAEIMEYAKDLDRGRGDMPEICVWSDTIGVWGKKLMYIQAVHQESDVVPENIDAIRAAMGACGQQESIAMTNASLGLI